MVSFELKGDIAAATRFVKATRVFTLPRVWVGWRA